MRVTASQNAARTSRLLTTTRMEAITSTALSTTNATSSQSTAILGLPDARVLAARHVLPPHDPGAGPDQDREQGVRDEPLPSDLQDLVEPDPRFGPRDPDEDQAQDPHFEEEVEFLGEDGDRDRARVHDREDGSAPAAQVEDRDERGARDHSQPLETEHDAEPHPAVPRRPAFDELRLGLRDVERDALHLRDDRDGKDHEPEGLRAEDVPAGNREEAELHEGPGLLLHDVEQVQAPGREH